MSKTLEKIQALIRDKKIRISDHTYDELLEDGLLASELISGIEAAVVVEDYPDYVKGPCVLVLQRDASGSPIHALWGISAGKSEPGVLITAYRPDTRLWDSSFLRRR